MDRDALLTAALGAAVLAGCTAESRPRPLPSGSPSSAAPDPDAALLASWAAAERAAAGRYAVALRAVPGLAPLRDNHLRRATAAEALLGARGGTPSPSPAATPPRGAVPTVLRALASAERDLARAYLAALASAADAEVAVLGAELAAGARQHAALLPLVRVPKR